MSRLERLQTLFKAGVTEIKASLRRQRWKEAFIFSSFVLLSLGFWLMVSLQQEYETEIAIPIRYENVPPDIAFQEDLPQAIIVRIKDRGSVLLNYSVKRSFAPLKVDMKDLKEKSGQFTIPQERIETTIAKQIMATTVLTGFEPRQIALTYSPIASKEVPIRFDGVVRTIPGFQISGEIQLTPATAKIYATEEVLDTIHEIKTEFLEIDKGSKSITHNLKLIPISGVNMDTEATSVQIPIEEYTEKTLAIPVVCQDIPSDYAVRTFPLAIRVTCNIPLSRFKDLDEDDLAVLISYKDLERETTGAVTIDLTQRPDWVQHYTLNPSKIEFILEKKNY